MNLIMNGAIAIAIYAGRSGRTFDPRVRNLHVNGTNNNHVCSRSERTDAAVFCSRTRNAYVARNHGLDPKKRRHKIHRIAHITLFNFQHGISM